MVFGSPQDRSVFEDALGRPFLCAVFSITDVDDLRDLRSAFDSDWPVEARLVAVRDARLKTVVDYIDGMVGAAGGELWEVEDSVLLLLPHGGPPDWSWRDQPDDGSEPSGDREPRRPLTPVRTMHVELDLEPHRDM